jgi:hypothetical protein
MSSLSFADKIEGIHLMLGGLANNTDKLAKRGVSPEFITAFTTAYNEVLALDREQAALIARQKEKTLAINEKLDDTMEYYREARKIVKLDFPQESWKEFGIDVQR